MRRFANLFILCCLMDQGLGLASAEHRHLWAGTAQEQEITSVVPTDLAPPIAPRREDRLDELPEEVFVSLDPKDDPSHPIHWSKTGSGPVANKKPVSTSKTAQSTKLKNQNNVKAAPKLSKNAPSRAANKAAQRKPAKAKNKSGAAGSQRR